MVLVMRELVRCWWMHRVAQQFRHTTLGAETGTTAIEYALIAGAIVLVIVGSVATVGATTNNLLNLAAGFQGN